MSDCNNYRGISLLSIPGKVLTSVLASRLAKVYDSKLFDGQHGFRPHRGTHGALTAMRSLMADAKAQRTTLYACFIDLRKAFDCVPRDVLWRTMSTLGFPAKLVNMLSSLHENSMLAVKDGGFTSKKFAVTTGVKQGCCIAPLLFNLLIDTIMKGVLRECEELGVRVNVRSCSMGLDQDLASGRVEQLKKIITAILYADDCVILAQNRTELEKIFKILSTHLSAYGLVINMSKTKVSIVGKPDLVAAEKNRGFHFGGETIEVVDSFKYLGSKLDFENVNLTSEINYRASKAKAALIGLNKKVWLRKEISVELKLKIFKTVVQSHLTYGIAAWVPNLADIYLMEGKYMAMLRLVLGIRYDERLSNVRVRTSHSLPTFESRVHKARLRLFGVLARQECSSELKSIVYSEIVKPVDEPRQRSQGNSWIIGVRKSVDYLIEAFRNGDPPSVLDTSDIVTLTLDKKEWESKLQVLDKVRITGLDIRRRVRRIRDADAEGYCHICGDNFTTIAGLTNHIRQKHAVKRKLNPSAIDQGKRNVPCDFPSCKRVFDNPRALRIHRTVTHLRPRQPAIAANQREKKFKCKKCPKSYTSGSSLKRHEREVHLKAVIKGGEFKCDLPGCTGQFNNIRARSIHAATCRLRSKVSSDPEKKYPPSPYPCQLCNGKPFRKQDAFHKHMNWHKQFGHE